MHLLSPDMIWKKPAFAWDFGPLTGDVFLRMSWPFSPCSTGNVARAARIWRAIAKRRVASNIRAVSRGERIRFAFALRARPKRDARSRKITDRRQENLQGRKALLRNTK